MGKSVLGFSRHENPVSMSRIMTLQQYMSALPQYCSATFEIVPGKSSSSLLMNTIRSPVELCIPLLNASEMPLSGSEMTFAMPLYLEITSRVESVLPPSIMTYSVLG